MNLLAVCYRETQVSLIARKWLKKSVVGSVEPLPLAYPQSILVIFCSIEARTQFSKILDQSQMWDFVH